ncbi:MAG: hypothetical protein AB3N63_11580 [Puniceicoccaceae bacterium]
MKGKMSDPADKISLWTEGLDESWSMDSSQADHMDRGPQSIEEIMEHVDMLVFRYGDDLDCKLILRFKERTLHLQLSSKLMEASDPNDQTYQNIPVAQDNLYQFLDEFIYEEPEPDEGRINFREDKKGIIAMLCAVGVLIVAIYFSGFYGSDDEGFMPVPTAVQLQDPMEIQQFYEQNAGVYATAIDDGEMVIELTAEGTWAYFDLVKRTSRKYGAEMVSGGEYVPGKEEEVYAIVTDQRFVFYPKSEGELEFLQRSFRKVAVTREELAYLDLPAFN